MAESAASLVTPPGQTPADVRPERLRSLDPLAFPAVTGREEEWRFTPLDRLADLFAVSDAAADDPAARPAGRLEIGSVLPDGVTLRVAEAGDPVLAAIPLPADRLAAAAVRGAEGALVLDVAAEAVPGSAATLRLTGTGLAAVSAGHLVVHVGAHAQATVVLEHGGAARHLSAVSVVVADGASLELVHVQDWDAGSAHTAHVGFHLGRDARVTSTQVSLGGDLVRVVETVDYAGPGGSADLAGLAFAQAGQHLEHRLFVDHAVPQCRSRVTYRTALRGTDAHVVWVGDVLIRAAAVGTDTYELNRNLLLSADARADSVPNLEIETGEIAGAGHASATGRFDDEQLFYLQARGIPADEARRMVVAGFFAELLDRLGSQALGVEDLRDRLLASVEARLVAGGED